MPLSWGSACLQGNNKKAKAATKAKVKELQKEKANLKHQHTEGLSWTKWRTQSSTSKPKRIRLSSSEIVFPANSKWQWLTRRLRGNWSGIYHARPKWSISIILCSSWVLTWTSTVSVLLLYKSFRYLGGRRCWLTCYMNQAKGILVYIRSMQRVVVRAGDRVYPQSISS